MKYLILLVSFTTFFTFAQDNKSQAILTKLSTKIKGLSSFYIEFNAVVTQPNGKSESEIGKGWVKGNKFSAAMAT